MIYINIFLYSVAIFLLLKSIMIIPERQAWVIQRLGKFNRISKPGLKLKIPFIEVIASKENLRIQQLDVDVETKTLDDVFVIFLFFTKTITTFYILVKTRNNCFYF